VGFNHQIKIIMRYIRYNYPTRQSLPVAAFGRGAWNGLDSEINHLFNAALAGTTRAPNGSRFPVDVYQDENSLHVRAELPGFKRDAIKVEVVDGYLTLEASRERPDEKAPRAATFNRSIALPDDVKADGVSAAYVDGILSVTLPKKEEAKPRKISVAVK
jgi:HSP20 family protein